MTDDTDPATIIENTLRSSVLPGLLTRIRPMSDDVLALDILQALEDAGYDIVRKDRGAA